MLPSNLIEHQEVARLNDTFENYKKISGKVLLMFGSKSPKFFSFEQPRVLKSILANSETHRFRGLDHFGPDKTGPKEVAKFLYSFFNS